MSLNTLARQALVSRVAARAQPAMVQKDNPPNEASRAPPPVPTHEDALSGIAKYIPTEVVTLFLFGLTVLPKQEDEPRPWINVETLYWTLVGFTPACFYLLFTAKWRALEVATGWPKAADTPWFQLVGATIGFVIWAAAIPKTGLVDEKYAVLLGFAALFTSTVLSLVEKVVEPKSSVS